MVAVGCEAERIIPRSPPQVFDGERVAPAREIDAADRTCCANTLTRGGAVYNLVRTIVLLVDWPNGVVGHRVLHGNSTGRKRR